MSQMTDDIVYAPWDDDTVNSLNRYQTNETYHPYTCEEGHLLVATKDGWVCSEKENGCDYEQNWYWKPTD